MTAELRDWDCVPIVLPVAMVAGPTAENCNHGVIAELAFAVLMDPWLVNQCNGQTHFTHVVEH